MRDGGCEVANAADIPMGEFAEGLYEIATLAIPYARLPGASPQGLRSGLHVLYVAA
jgi:hypothetical protein